jgi:hypothetical protein
VSFLPSWLLALALSPGIVWLDGQFQLIAHSKKAELHYPRKLGRFQEAGKHVTTPCPPHPQPLIPSPREVEKSLGKGGTQPQNGVNLCQGVVSKISNLCQLSSEEKLWIPT